MQEIIAAGIWSGALRRVSNEIFNPPVLYTQFGTTVALSAMPALQAAVNAHLHYDRSDTGAQPAWQVFCILDASLWDRFVTRANLPWAGCLDYGDLGFVEATPGGRVALDWSTRTIIAVEPETRRIAVVAVDPRGAFAFAYKAVRAAMTAEQLSARSVSLHASAVVMDGAAIAFMGAKGTGKSTALLHALASGFPGLRYLGNDRILLRDGSKCVQALAWPTVAAFGVGSLQAMRGIDRIVRPDLHLRGGGIAYLLLDLPLISGPPSTVGKTGKVRLSPSEIEAAFGVALAGEAPLAAVVNGRLSLNNPKTVLKEVDDPERRLELIAQNFDAPWTTHPDWMGLVEVGLPPPMNKFLTELLTKVRVIEAQWGLDMEDVVLGLCSDLRHRSLRAAPMRAHFGVYALIVMSGRVLLVRKARGPYTGWLDLPGGRPEPGEGAEEALTREMREELGATVWPAGPWFELDLSPTHDSRGEPIAFRHMARVRRAYLEGPADQEIHDGDVDGALWIDAADWRKRADLSPLARAALERIGC